jgi:hypothetical protein
MDFLYSGAFLSVLSTGALALYEHLSPVQRHLLPPVFGLCCNALGLTNELIARHLHYLRHPSQPHPGRAQDVAANLAGIAGSRWRNANPSPHLRRSADRRDDRAPDAQRPGQVVRTCRTTRP